MSPKQKTHHLKCTQPFFSQLQRGTKTFEIRFNDREYEVGDHVVLKEYDPSTNTYSGDTLKMQITYLLSSYPGIAKQFCILAVKPVYMIDRETLIAPSADYIQEANALLELREQMDRKLEHMRQHNGSVSLPIEIWMTYDRRDGEVFAAFTSENRCKIESESTGCAMQKCLLHYGERDER